MEAGERIREARISRKMTVTSLARASGLTKGFISQLEGRKSNASLTSLARIASALDVSLASLLSLESLDTNPKTPAGVPAIVTARNLYQDRGGPAPLTGLQSGTHFVATVPPEHALSSQAGIERATVGAALVVALQGSVSVLQGGAELQVERALVAAFDPGAPYLLANDREASAVLLIFLPTGCAVPSLVKIAPRTVLPNMLPAYASAVEGPMRLAAMRAQRQKERGR